MQWIPDSLTKDQILFFNNGQNSMFPNFTERAHSSKRRASPCQVISCVPVVHSLGQLCLEVKLKWRLRTACKALPEPLKFSYLFSCGVMKHNCLKLYLWHWTFKEIWCRRKELALGPCLCAEDLTPQTAFSNLFHRTPTAFFLQTDVTSKYVSIFAWFMALLQC